MARDLLRRKTYSALPENRKGDHKSVKVPVKCRISKLQKSDDKIEEVSSDSSHSLTVSRVMDSSVENSPQKFKNVSKMMSI